VNGTVDGGMGSMCIRYPGTSKASTKASDV
jgi:hypothetical protein